MRTFARGVLWLCFFAFVCGNRSGAEEFSAWRETVLSAVNSLRAKHQARPLTVREDLEKIAAAYARELAARGELSHFDAQGRDLAKRLLKNDCADWKSAGENLARNERAGFVAGDVVRAWNISAGHYRNLIAPEFRFTGIGWALDARREFVYCVQIFVE